VGLRRGVLGGHGAAWADSHLESYATLTSVLAVVMIDHCHERSWLGPCEHRRGHLDVALRGVACRQRWCQPDPSTRREAKEIYPQLADSWLAVTKA
jgi:hypothetical protein